MFIRSSSIFLSIVALVAATTAALDAKSVCGSQGRAAKCCTLPVAGQDLLCTELDTSGACTSMLYSQLQCCSTDVLGVADLDCSTPTL
ncbi:hypothetical protein BDN67DRAFT_1014725 [Paxillus ammoniavirescens]|nr:hypothetical protein BDN67DRAFT_1014725 [Paxillus ammoniavirescens]